MKEVCQRTGLTDRAVRLYIDNDLIHPDCDVSYSGRKKLDFSESDVQQLSNIAILRKADFSISEIKAILQGGKASKDALVDYIKNVSENIEKNRRILKALEPLQGAEDLTVEMICRQLTCTVAEEKMPVSDMRLSLLERIENIIYLVLSISVIIIYIILPFLVENVLYPAPDLNGIISLFATMIVIVHPIALLVIRYIYLFRPGKNAGLRIVSIGIALFVFASLLRAPFVLTYLNANLCTVSKTENPTDYLRVDDYVAIYSGEIYEYFPVTIPDSAIAEDSVGYPPEKFPETTKYYYRYEDGDGNLDFDIVAEFKLSEEEYHSEKERLLSKTDEIKKEKKKGQWQCVYYRDVKERDVYNKYYFINFAYNDKSNTVRYIISCCIDANFAVIEPYYFSLDWK